MNNGVIGNTGKTLIQANEIKNKSIGDYFGEITGDKTSLIAFKNLSNSGAKISATEELVLIAKNITNESTTREIAHNNSDLDRSRFNEIASAGQISSNGLTYIEADKYTSKGAFTSGEKVVINAKNVNLDSIELTGEQKFGTNSDNFQSYGFKKNIGSTVEGKNIEISTENDLNIKASNINAEDNLKIIAENINIVSATDSTLYETKSNSKGSFGSSKSKEDISYQTHNIASNLIGNNVNVEAKKDISILGSNIQANEKGNIKAEGNITQAGVKNISYEYHHTSKKGLFGLASKSITDESYQENAVRSATMSGDKGLTYDSKNNLVLTGVTVVSKGNIDLKANNVTINSLETKSNIKHEEKKKSFKADLSLKGSNYSYGKDKLESNTDIVKQNSSQIVSEKDVNINANDKVKATSVDIFAKNDINISGDKGIEISTANNIFNNETKQSSIRISTGLSVNKSITETIDNVKNIKSLTDFSGDSYDITNKASNLVGAIKTGAGAANDLMNFKYKGENQTGAETLKNNPKLITVGSSISHNKSETKTHNENVEKSSLKSNNMNISSKDGNILISGADIEVKNDLKIAAKKDITIKASEEKNSSSHSSKGINLAVSMDLSEDSTLNVSANQSKAKGNSNGTSYINSTIKVGNELKTNSENIALSGANVEANTVDIKAKNITIESLQNKSETKESTSNIGGSVSIDPTTGNVKGIGLNVGRTKGNGNGSWTENQTTLIIKNGGKIDADSLTNTGAVIASESENNKLKISANEIKVSNLEDNNKYENIGGGINFSASVSNGNISPKVPNLSVVHDKVEKEQITRATAINTEISLKGKAEELGFNTDREKSQEVTKDNEKHLNADLHTDLANKENRDSIIDGYKKVRALTEIEDINKFKESMEGIMFNRFANNHQKEINFIKNTSQDLNLRRSAAQDFMNT